MALPTVTARLHTGDFLDLDHDVEMVDIEELLKANAPDAMTLKIEGQTGLADIDDGDWIVASRSARPVSGDIVVARIQGGADGFLLRRFRVKRGKTDRGLHLVAVGGKSLRPPPLPIEIEPGVEIVAVVVYILQHARTPRRRSRQHHGQ